MKNKLKVIFMIAGLGTFSGLITTGCGTVRAGYESAPYQVVCTSDRFEVRDYPSMSVVETTMAPNSNGLDGSFNRLFRFISGGNESKQKIAMTTPVFMSVNKTNATMCFVMPAKMKASDVPRPSDGDVKVRELEAGRFAVLRFSGGPSAGNEAAALEQLRDRMKSKGLEGLSLPTYAYFDPPWTPPWLRRNEVMVRAKSSGMETCQ